MSKALWTIAAMAEAMKADRVGSLPEGITGISIDSRSLEPGDAFFAITGEAMDGHDFATAAVKAGAAVLVVAEGKLPSLGRLTAPMIVVQDVLAALEKLGVAARARVSAHAAPGGGHWDMSTYLRSTQFFMTIMTQTSCVKAILWLKFYILVI